MEKEEGLEMKVKFIIDGKDIGKFDCCVYPRIGHRIRIVENLSDKTFVVKSCLHTYTMVPTLTEEYTVTMESENA